MAAECNYVSLAFMLLAVLLIVMLPELSKSIPQIRSLFTNNVNFMLLLAITICIILLDMPSGIMFALWVIYGTYYYQRVSLTDISNSTSSKPDFSSKLVSLTPSTGDVPTSMLRVPVEKGLLEPFTSSPMKCVLAMILWVVGWMVGWPCKILRCLVHHYHLIVI